MKKGVLYSSVCMALSVYASLIDQKHNETVDFSKKEDTVCGEAQSLSLNAQKSRYTPLQKAFLYVSIPFFLSGLCVIFAMFTPVGVIIGIGLMSLGGGSLGLGFRGGKKHSQSSKKEYDPQGVDLVVQGHSTSRSVCMKTDFDTKEPILLASPKAPASDSSEIVEVIEQSQTEGDVVFDERPAVSESDESIDQLAPPEAPASDSSVPVEVIEPSQPEDGVALDAKQEVLGEAMIETVRSPVKHRPAFVSIMPLRVSKDRSKQPQVVPPHEVQEIEKEIQEYIAKEDFKFDQTRKIDLLRTALAHRNDYCLVSLCKSAACKGDLIFVKALYQLHDSQDGKGQKIVYNDGDETALMLAVQNNRVECVRFLAEKECGRKNSSGQTALEIALQKEKPEMVYLLCTKEWHYLKSGVQIENADVWNKYIKHCRIAEDRLDALLESEQNDTEIHGLYWSAAYHNRLDLLQRISPKIGDFVVRIGTDAETALMVAAKKGNIECVKFLAAKEAGLDNKHGYTALMLAVMNENFDCVEYLASCEKEIGHQNLHQRTALMMAASLGRAECMQFLMCDKELGQKGMWGYTALMWAVLHNRVGCVQLLAQHDKELGHQDARGKTALMHAAERGHDGCMQFLLCDKELGQKGKWDCTALMWAVLNNRVGCVQLLTQRDKELGHQDAYGKTALMHAAARGHERCIVDQLIRSEIGIIALNGKSAQSAMSIAVKGGHEGVLKVFIDAFNRKIVQLHDEKVLTELRSVRSVLAKSSINSALKKELDEWCQKALC